MALGDGPGGAAKDRAEIAAAVASIEPEAVETSVNRDVGNVGNPVQAAADVGNVGNRDEGNSNVGNLIDQVLAIVNAGNVGNAGKIGDAGLRIEINRRVLKNGKIQLYWVWRRRGKNREHYAYGGTAETLAEQYPERLARYKARHNNSVEGVSTSKRESPGGD